MSHPTRASSLPVRGPAAAFPSSARVAAARLGSIAVLEPLARPYDGNVDALLFGALAAFVAVLVGVLAWLAWSFRAVKAEARAHARRLRPHRERVGGALTREEIARLVPSHHRLLADLVYEELLRPGDGDASRG